MAWMRSGAKEGPLEYGNFRHFRVLSGQSASSTSDCPQNVMKNHMFRHKSTGFKTMIEG